MDATMQALADPTRRDILRTLRDAPQRAGAIADQFSISRPAVSRHLRRLREAGLVREEVAGREHVYALELGPLAEVDAFIATLRLARDAEHAEWQHRFMRLETEVYRVRTRRVASQTKGPHHRKKESG